MGACSSNKRFFSSFFVTYLTYAYKKKSIRFDQYDSLLSMEIPCGLSRLLSLKIYQNKTN